MRRLGKLLVIGALAWSCLPGLAGAEQAGTGTGSPGTTAAPETADAATASASETADAATASASETADAATANGAETGHASAAPEVPDPDAKIDAYPGVIHKVMADGMLVRRAGRTSDPRAPGYMAFAGRLGVPVEGQGKNSWLALRRGDVVMVSYVKGPPHRVTKVTVLPRPSLPKLSESTPVPNQRRQRTFVGYIKKKDGDELIVMSPRAAPPGRREAELKAFVRTEATKVEVLRHAWDELRKGDRVRIGHQKGNPRPIDVVQVIRRGGEQPLPPGLATRLFHPDYDESVRDVDGIGETGPVPRPPPRRGGGIRLRGGGP